LKINQHSEIKENQFEIIYIFPKLLYILTHKTDKNENINVHIEEESINKKKIIKFH
jgi:hypothetical protein